MTRRKFLALGGCTICAGLAASRPSFAQSAIEGRGYRLWHIGGMRETIMGGQRAARLDLRTLAGRPGLLGLGPLEGLTGEATIVDSRPSLVRVQPDGTLRVEESFAAGAPFFVWAEVSAWQARPLPDSVQTYTDLESFMDTVTDEAASRPAFPFKIVGRVASVGFHVVDAPPDLPPGMDGHTKIQRHFERSAVEATLAGFWSRDHRGVFTPAASNLHIHLQTADNTASGHVESMRLSQGMQLLLPQG